VLETRSKATPACTKRSHNRPLFCLQANGQSASQSTIGKVVQPCNFLQALSYSILIVPANPFIGKSKRSSSRPRHKVEVMVGAV
jgi:hypothetical protein